MYKKIVLSFLLIVIPSIILAAVSKEDFKFYKDIQEVNQNGIYYFDIDSDIESNSEKYLSDIRIFSDNQEVKYKIEKEKDIYQNSENNIDLDIVKQNKNEYIIDLNNEKEEEYLNNILLETNSTDFRRVVKVQGADLKDGPYFDLDIEKNRGDLVYSLPEGSNLSIDFKYSNYKYLKLVFSGDEGEFKEDGFYRIEKKTNIIPGEKDFLKIIGNESPLENNDQKIIFDTKKNNLFFDQVKVIFADKRFDRKYVLYSADSAEAEILESGKRIDPKKDYWVKISSGSFKKEIYTGNPVISLKNNKRFYRLDILNGDNEKLDYKSTTFEKFKRKIYFRVDKNDNLKVYYSSNKIDRPKYDFILSDSQIKAAKKLELGIEKNNSGYIAEKKSIFDNNKWLIYVLIGFIVFVLIFFVYKIIKENSSKIDRDGMQI